MPTNESDASISNSSKVIAKVRVDNRQKDRQTSKQKGQKPITPPSFDPIPQKYKYLV